MFSRPGARWSCLALVLAGLFASALAGRAAVAASTGRDGPGSGGEVERGRVWERRIAATDERFRITRWTTDQGLPQNRVSALQQTRDGYLWIGSWFGLARFDGVRFEVFQKHTTPELEDDAINSLAEDVEGTLWIGTARGLVRHRGGRFERWTGTSGWEQQRIWRLAPSATGGMWAQAANAVVYLRDGKTIQEWRVPLLPPETGIRYLAEGAGRRLVAVTDLAVLSLAVGEPGWTTNLLVAEAGLPRIASAALGPAGQVDWLGTVAGLYTRTGGTWRRVDEQGSGPAHVSSVFRDQDGGVWAALRAIGLDRWDGGSWSPVELGERLMAPSVTCVLQDVEEGIWVGTEQGLVLLRPRRVRAFTRREGLLDDQVWSVAEGKDGTMWVGTDRGMNRIRDGRVGALGVSDPSMDRASRSVWPAFDGGVWVGRYGVGLYHVGTTMESVFENKDLAGGSIAALFEDPSGALWVGSPGGVAVCRGREVVARHGRRWGQPVSEVRCILRDRSGAMWFGQGGAGLARLKDGQFQSFTARDGLSDDRVWALHEDGEGTLWIGTDNGLTRFRDGRFHAFTQAAGLRENLVNWILEDDDGFLWLSGLRGLYRVSLRQLNAVADGEARWLECAVFGVADGMESSETNGEGAPSGWKSRDGRLWFPTVQGVVVVDPKAIRSIRVFPPVRIEQVKAGGTVIHGDGVGRAGAGNLSVRKADGDGDGGGVRVPPDLSRIMEFRYTAITFADPGRARFRFRLVGHDADWRDGQADRVVHYTNLRPGLHRFELTAANHLGIWNPVPDQFAFVVEPHFYETWPFYGLCAAAVLALAGLFTADRLRWQHRLLSARHAEALAEERTRIARDLHDDLGTALTGVALELDVARQQPAARVAERIAGTATRVRGLAERMREVVWAVNPRCDTLSSLAGFLEQQAAQFLLQTALRVRLDFPDDIPGLHLDADTRHQLALGVREALTNVVRHSEATEAVVRLTVEPGLLQVEVKDNGRGFDPAALGSRGEGLASLRQRMERLGGTFVCDSAPGGGTRCLFKVPIRPIPGEGPRP